MQRIIRNLLLITFILLTFSGLLIAQKPYYVSGGEWIFSGSKVVESGTRLSTNTRFTVLFHLEEEIHYDFTNYLGVYTGLGLRNIGLIIDDFYSPAGENAKIKHRSFSLGVPAVIKAGSFKKGSFLYGGAEMEYLFHYKQKLFIDGKKLKFTEWNSKRVNLFNPSIFVGFQFPSGANLKAKWYLKNFLNSSFSGRDFSYDIDYSAYEESRIFYISLSIKLGPAQIKKLLDEKPKTYNASL